ncbi:toll/interleukin-1 receptor domain-containing protein [Spongorhabdus nitratireducens]
MNKKKIVFISYSWHDMKIANEIEQDLSKFQIDLVRDVRDLEYKSKISDFMGKIRETDFAILLISRNYLSSKNCMKEVLHILKDTDFNSKILPVIVDGTKIYSIEDRLEYTKYWIKEKDSISTLISSIPATAIINEISELKVVEEIVSKVNDFLSYISDLKNLTFKELKDDGYKPILNCLGFVNITHLVELLKISNIDDIETKEILLDEWLENNNPVSDAYSIRASIASKRGNIRKAEFNYEKAIELNCDNYYAMNNYAFMLFQLDKNKELARSLLDNAVKNLPNFTIARLNLGCLLSNKFNDHIGAKNQYEKIISYNPTEERAYNNLANYYKQCRNNNEENQKIICELYEKALSINPDYLEAHLAYGSYLSEIINKHDIALKHYDEILRIDPESKKLVDWLKNRIKEVIKQRKSHG